MRSYAYIQPTSKAIRKVLAECGRGEIFHQLRKLYVNLSDHDLVKVPTKLIFLLFPLILLVRFSTINFFSSPFRSIKFFHHSLFHCFAYMSYVVCCCCVGVWKSLKIQILLIIKMINEDIHEPSSFWRDSIKKIPLQ